MNNFDLINQATELFELKLVDKDHYLGLLFPGNSTEIFTESPFAYSRPALSVEFLIRFCPEESKYCFFGCIRSIDDSGVSIFGPNETYEIAKSRLDKFKEFIESCDYRCPGKDLLKQNCQIIGVYADYW
jgi:hypothetical protein